MMDFYPPCRVVFKWQRLCLVRRCHPPRKHWTLPLSTAGFEFGFPALLWLVFVYCRDDGSGISSSTSAASVSNAGHGVVRGLYPFTMLMAPFYVMGVIPDRVGNVVSAFVKASSTVHVLTLEMMVVAVDVSKAIQTAAVSDLFEYTSYFTWELGILWSLVVFGILAGIGLFAQRSYFSEPPSSSSTADAPQKKKKTAGRLPLAFL